MFKDLISKDFVLFVLLALFGFLIFSKLNNKTKSKDVEDNFSTNELTLEDLIVWFKEHINKEDKNVIAVLMKETKYESILGENLKSNKLYNLTLIQCFFDKERNIIKKNRVIYCKSISNDLEKMFQEKDMIVFN